MKTTTTPKKLMLAAIMTSGLCLAFSQAALAETAKPTPPETQVKPTTLPCQIQTGTEIHKAHDKFLNETVAIRKEMAEKNAVLRALMNAGTPDTVKASQVAGELFEMREKLRIKAQETGLPFPMLMMGGHGCDSMPCQGMGGKRHRMM